MDTKSNSLGNLVLTALVVTTALFLLNKYFNKEDRPHTGSVPNNTPGNSNTGLPQLNPSSGSAKHGIKQIELFDTAGCPFPDEMFVQYNDNYQHENWGALNENAPDFSQNKF